MTEIRRLTFVVALTLVCTAAGTSASSTALEARESSYGYPAWSPDGRRLAYQSGGSVRGYEIWVADADGKNRRKLTSGHVDGSPTWSRNGAESPSTVSATGRRMWEVWVMDGDGGRPRRLVRGENPAWSPNGGKIALWRSGLRLISADGGREQLLNRANGYGAAWSPDGRNIVFDCGNRKAASAP